ncbi:MAG: hypothetical protein U0263_31420 [Polyangiaceae bacterium]
MDDTGGMAIATALGLGVLVFGGRIIAQVTRNHLARVHAIRSIPLPRHTTLMSWQPKGQVEAVFLDAFDTEYRRHFDGEPHYEKHSAQEIAELRVFLLGRAFQRSELRILYETEIGVPLLRKLEDRDAEVCAWAQERLKVHRPLFRKPCTIDDLVLKPSRFRWFLWTCGIGASQVLFFERIFQALPITVVVRRLGPAATTNDAVVKTPKSLPPSPAEQPDRAREAVESLSHDVLDALQTGDDETSRNAIREARTKLGKLGDGVSAVTDGLVRDLARFEERLDTFEDAFANETQKNMDDWADWLREALTDATGGADLASLGEEAVLDAFKRRARFRWVTAKDAAPQPAGNRVGESAGEEDAGPSAEQPNVIDTTGEAADDARTPEETANRSADAEDAAAKIGF